MFKVGLMAQAITTPIPKRSSHSFECGNCGASLVYGAESEKLDCGYCDSAHDIPENSSANGTVEEEKLQELFSSARDKQMMGDRVLECEQCGASVTVSESSTTATCAFCASAMVKEQEPTEQMVPSAVIPFTISQEEAQKAHKAWLSTLWFRPNNLKNQAKIAVLDGVYTPFWTFDAKACTRWRAQSGTHYYESESYQDEKGRTRRRQVRKTRWEACRGEREQAYDDILICGSRGLGESLVRRLEPYHTTEKLEAYRPEFLAGWRAEEYGRGPEEAWLRAKDEIEALEYQASSEEIPGDTHRFLQTTTQLASPTGKYVLLPVWVAAFRYQDVSYRFLVNGETGAVSGEAPYSRWKQVLFALLMILVVFTILGSGGLALFPWGGVALVWYWFWGRG